MSERQGTVGALDATSGKRISNLVITLPAGTILTNADGTTTTLASDTPAFLQRVVLGDPEMPLSNARVRRQKLQVEDVTLQVLERMSTTLEEINFKLDALK